MSLDYHKGRYDELVERHKEVLEMYKQLQWEMHTSNLTSGSGVHGAEVNYYAGVKVDPKTIGLTIGGGGITFSILAYLLGIVPLTFGLTISAFGLLYGFLSYIRKDPEQKTATPHPSYPMPPQQKR